jgi:hypothetical protein
MNRARNHLSPGFMDVAGVARQISTLRSLLISSV